MKRSGTFCRHFSFFFCLGAFLIWKLPHFSFFKHRIPSFHLSVFPPKEILQLLLLMRREKKIYLSGNQANERQADVTTKKEQNQLPLFMVVYRVQKETEWRTVIDLVGALPLSPRPTLKSPVAWQTICCTPTASLSFWGLSLDCRSILYNLPNTLHFPNIPHPQSQPRRERFGGRIPHIPPWSLMGQSWMCSILSQRVPSKIQFWWLTVTCFGFLSSPVSLSLPPQAHLCCAF